MRQVRCPDCRAMLRIRDGMAGTVRCPKCSAAIELEEDIPVVGAAEPTPRAPRPALKHSVSEKPSGARGAVPPPAAASPSSPRRSRREEARSSGPSVVLLLLAFAGVFLVLVCAGGAIVGY